MGFGDLALFTARCGFGHGGSLGTASGFDALCGGGSGGLFGFAQGMSHGGVGVLRLMSAGSLGCMARGRFCCGGGGFGLGLCQQRLFSDLLGSTMSQLRAVLAARGGEVAILRSVEIRPGVEDRHIFRGLGYCWIIGLVRAARIHDSCSCRSDTVLVLSELRRFSARSKEACFALVIMQ
jgi:hypothetical protein